MIISGGMWKNKKGQWTETNADDVSLNKSA